MTDARYVQCPDCRYKVKALRRHQNRVHGGTPRREEVGWGVSRPKRPFRYKTLREYAEDPSSPYVEEIRL
jgi:DNA-directed RNA polymerase subunit RPC12/RpoP